MRSPGLFRVFSYAHGARHRRFLLDLASLLSYLPLHFCHALHFPAFTFHSIMFRVFSSRAFPPFHFGILRSGSLRWLRPLLSPAPSYFRVALTACSCGVWVPFSLPPLSRTLSLSLLLCPLCSSPSACPLPRVLLLLCSRSWSLDSFRSPPLPFRSYPLPGLPFACLFFHPSPPGCMLFCRSFQFCSCSCRAFASGFLGRCLGGCRWRAFCEAALHARSRPSAFHFMCGLLPSVAPPCGTFCSLFAHGSPHASLLFIPAPLLFLRVHCSPLGGFRYVVAFW